MTAQCDPANSQIPDLTEHFELAQGCISTLPDAVPPDDGQFTESATITDQSKFMRLSSESFPDLDGEQLEVLWKLCLAAHRSEEFFLPVATNQWLRTAIKSTRACGELFSSTEESSGIIDSDITIHSNVLPCDPFWPKPRAIRDEAGCLASTRVHFPCYILKEENGKTLMTKLHEWQGECDIGKSVQERLEDRNIVQEILEDRNIVQERLEDRNIVQQKPLKKFWKILVEDVAPQILKSLTGPENDTVCLITWRGGHFVRKGNPSKEDFETELKLVKRLCHPHIVYIFGLSYDGKQSSLYMEYMENDLEAVIVEKVRATVGLGPPFSHQDSVDILLQVAKAMAHMHEEKVIHGDLKSANILISEFEISDNRYHYVAKVADFDSARESGSTPFKPGRATTFYAAPEVLELRGNENVVISFPEKIDVYSFGIVAFEVLTGEELYRGKSMAEVKRDVTEGPLRPPLREFLSGKVNFLNDVRLISLIESCWLRSPSSRPSFSRIVEVLNSVKVQILEAPTSLSNHPPRQENSVPNTSGALEEAASESDGHHPPSPKQANNTSVALHGQDSVPSVCNGHHSAPPVQAFTSDALDGQRNKSSRRQRSLWKFLRHFSCVSGGTVKS